MSERDSDSVARVGDVLLMGVSVTEALMEESSLANEGSRGVGVGVGVGGGVVVRVGGVAGGGRYGH